MTGPDETRLRELIVMRKVRDRIDREYANPSMWRRSRAEWHMSAGHLSRCFREAYGEFALLYLMTRRSNARWHCCDAETSR